MKKYLTFLLLTASSTLVFADDLKLNSPVDNANLPLKTAAKFSWSKAANAKKYRLVFSNDWQFANYDVQKNVCIDKTNCFVYVIATPSYSLSRLNSMLKRDDQYFYWKVQSIDKANNTSNFTQVYSFTVGNPTPPNIVSVLGAGSSIHIVLNKPLVENVYKLEVNFDSFLKPTYSINGSGVNYYFATNLTSPFVGNTNGTLLKFDILDQSNKVLDFSEIIFRKYKKEKCTKTCAAPAGVDSYYITVTPYTSKSTVIPTPPPDSDSNISKVIESSLPPAEPPTPSDSDFEEDVTDSASPENSDSNGEDEAYNENVINVKHPFNYIKISNDGTVLKNDSKLGTGKKDWACNKDKDTGLIWEIKTTDVGLRNWKNTYTWYDPNAKTNSGDKGKLNGGVCKRSQCDTYNYAVEVNKKGLCGRKDWRLPTQDELARLVTENEENNVFINSNYFPNTTDENYWTASNSQNSSYAWIVDFYNGIKGINPKNTSNVVRLVSGKTVASNSNP